MVRIGHIFACSCLNRISYRMTHLYDPGESRVVKPELNTFRSSLSSDLFLGPQVLKHQNVEYFDYITPP